MYEQVFTIKWECDLCNKEEIIQSESSDPLDLPEGWHQKQAGPEVFDMCPTCSENYYERERECNER